MFITEAWIIIKNKLVGSHLGAPSLNIHFTYMIGGAPLSGTMRVFQHPFRIDCWVCIEIHYKTVVVRPFVIIGNKHMLNIWNLSTFYHVLIGGVSFKKPKSFLYIFSLEAISMLFGQKIYESNTNESRKGFAMIV